MWSLPAIHFVPTRPPHPPYRSASGIGYASKKLFKMVGNPILNGVIISKHSRPVGQPSTDDGETSVQSS